MSFAEKLSILFFSLIKFKGNFIRLLVNNLFKNIIENKYWRIIGNKYEK